MRIHVRNVFSDQNVGRNLDFLGATLADSGWFAGEAFTAADIQMSFAVDAAEVRTNLREDYPNIAGYLDRIRARPAYQAAVERGGPYGLLSINRK